jgi:hypothetical protein
MTNPVIPYNVPLKNPRLPYFLAPSTGFVTIPFNPSNNPPAIIFIEIIFISNKNIKKLPIDIAPYSNPSKKCFGFLFF